MRCCKATQYADFGEEIKRLAENLQNLIRAVKKVSNLAANGPPKPQGTSEPEFDMSSLLEISGDFRDTLEQSKKLLVDHGSLGEQRGAITAPFINIRWNMTIRPSVQRLRERIAIHNRKVGVFVFLGVSSVDYSSCICHNIALHVART